MSIITGNIKDILEIKIKARHDSYTDQFSRIFMTKVFLISSLVMGVEWFHDSVACMVPKNSELSEEFVHSACWIQGFYVYPEMTKRLSESNYYGIPKNLDFDGLTIGGELCQSYTRQGLRNVGCRALTRRYYLQYQWMPFYIASLSIMFYMPYVMFRIINTDIISLRSSLRNDKIEADKVVQNYFNYQLNPVRKMRARTFLNTLVKALYVGVNIIAFQFTDVLLLGNFKNYGISWITWSHLNHTVAFDFFKGELPKPGNILLPSFGFCEIQEASMDVRNVFFNKSKFICEISPNILYQYVLIVLWFIMIISVIISVIGFLLHLSSLFEVIGCFCHDTGSVQRIYKVLTLRECEYLTFIRRKNMPLYGEVLRHLCKARHDMKKMNVNFEEILPLNNLNGSGKSSMIKKGTEEINWRQI